MKQIKVCKWLLLTAMLVIYCEGAPESSPWITPIPNLDAAMEGYDIIMANPLESPDPGIRNQIFEPMSELPDGRVVVHSFIDKVREDLHCDAELSSKTLRNYNEYSREKSSSHEFSLNADVSASAGFGGLFSFSASAGNGRRSTGEERSLQKLFQESKGEIIESKAVCITHVVGISLFEKPVFTHAFKTALKDLHFAAKTPDSENSRKVFVEFVQSYGTHFMKTSFLGSKLIFEKRFTSRSVDSKTQSSRSECVTKSAYASLGVKVFSAEVSSSFEMASKGCESASDSKAFFQQNGFTSEKVISIGSLPHGDLEKWSSTVKESPVPIYYELEKISTLFQSEWFDSISIDSADPDAEKLNRTRMFDFFEEMSSSFCVLLLGKDCEVQTQGCSYRNLCTQDQVCVDDPSSDLGYSCNDRKYGPAMVMGGYSGSEFFSSGDAIDTWTLPNLPYVVNGHTLSAVGDKIYSCGGYHFSGSSGSFTSSCYRLDRSATNSKWESISSLPSSMERHTAVTIRDHIWVVYSGKLYDLDTWANVFRTFHLPLTVSSGHCAVSNDSHSFILGAGSSKNEIWVNTEQYNPAKWHKVGDLLSGKELFGCVWFEKEIITTGGSSAQNDAEMFDTITHESRSAGTLLQGRRGHGMMVLDGKPAVVGGYNGKTAIDSIETYDEKTDLWETSQRKLISPRYHFGLVQLRG